METFGKARRGSRRREGSNPEDASAGDVGVPGTNRILCAGDRWRERNPMRGAGMSMSREWHAVPGGGSPVIP
jgi:hypothetical protein